MRICYTCAFIQKQFALVARRDTPNPKASPVYWWARDIESREVAPVQIWRSTSPAYNDTVVVFGDAEAYDVRFYELLEPIVPPSGA